MPRPSARSFSPQAYTATEFCVTTDIRTTIDGSRYRFIRMGKRYAFGAPWSSALFESLRQIELPLERPVGVCVRLPIGCHSNLPWIGANVDQHGRIRRCELPPELARAS